MSDKIAFYTNPMSRGQIARWALHEAGTDYDEHLLDYGTTMKATDYLKINPMGKVPAIVHQGNVVTEAAAICLYLAEAFPDASLLPENLAEKAAYLRWSFFGAGPVEQAIIAHSMEWDKEVAKDPQLQGRVGFGSYDKMVAVLADMLEERDYICGNRFTAADIYVGAQVDWGLMFGTLPEKPSFAAYAARLRSRDAYKAAKEIDGKHIAAAQGGGD